MQYGATIIVGEFGAGKSYFTHRSFTGFSGKNVIKIGNYTSPDFDIEFRSKEDLIKILYRIYEFKMNPDNFNQKIVIVVDEASLYFNSRDYKNFPPEMYPFLVQLRKLNVSLLLIVQKVNQLDIAFRRVAFEVIEYRKAVHIIRVCQHFEIETDEANIHDESSCSPGAVRPLLGPMLCSLWDRISFGFFASTRYDTNELILPQFSILRSSILDIYFPVTFTIKCSEDYISFIDSKRAKFL